MTIKSLFAGLLVSAATFSYAANYDDINKDMRIMKKIIETSISGNNRYSTRVEVMYLAKQGMVFTIHSSGAFHIPAPDGDWEAWGQAIGANTLSIVQEAIPAMAPILPPEAMAEMEAEIAQGMADLDGERSEVAAQIAEELRYMREQMRDNKEEYRDNLRELRELEREKYRAEKDRRDAIEQKRKALEKRIEQNKTKMDTYNEKMQEYRNARQKRSKEKRMAIINETIRAICDYNASLKSLDNDEHVTVIFNKFSESNKKDDRVYVFDKSDLSDCDSDDDGVKDLLKQATSYDL